MWTAEPATDWLATWREGLEPVTVAGLTVAPSWTHVPGADVIVIDPGMAFGTGHHATTRMCIEALRRRDLRGCDVLDVGTGSGVLALAAVRSGAGRVVAVDVDDDAVTTARANAVANGVTIDVRAGGVEAAGDERFDVVVANLVTSTLVELAPQLVARVGEDGALITSGIAEERSATVRDAFEALGAESVATETDEGWALVEVRVR